MMILGVDTGGTFTDFVLFDGQTLKIHKRLSTPEAPEQAILLGIKEMGLNPVGLNIIHGSTVATNAALEGKGVRTVFITNRGFKDMLTIGRQARRELYNLQPKVTAPPVPEELCLETGGRVSAEGHIIKALTDDDLQQLQQQLETLKPDAVAINLLFSFLNDEPEKRIEAIVPNNIFCSRSSAILPEYKEYERGIATWLNSWVGPLVERYIGRLKNGLPEATIAVMQSSGGTISAEQAGQLAVHMLLSGPAGGLAGAKYIGDLAGFSHLLTVDMGGTSTDVALIDGDLRLTNEGRIGPYPVAVPMVDMHTIGAGGGSIAYLDQGGMLQVGPESAGASPGPACYGQGGTRPTTTDANLVLGRLRPDAFLGGNMRLDLAAARAAIATIATPLNLSIEEAALGIIRIANEHMAQALRVISIQRGEDPKHYTLMPFGGAGGLHVCTLADALGMNRILVPSNGGVLSAFGMLAGRRSRELSRTIAKTSNEITEKELDAQFDILEQQATQALQEEGIEPQNTHCQRSLDLRYNGQSYSLNLLWDSLNNSVEQFHQDHEQRYGHQLHRDVEIVNIRLHAKGPETSIKLETISQPSNNVETQTAQLYDLNQDVQLIQRQTLSPAQEIKGPALILETVATTFIETGWQGSIDKFGNLRLQRQNK